MISADLSGKAVLVTGGASGIGYAAAEMFGRCGATVGINHLEDDANAPEKIAQLAKKGVTVYGFAGNVGDPDSAPHMVEQAATKMGRLDILINNAGTSGTDQPIEFKDLDRMTEEFWQQILTTNLLGAFRCARAAAPWLTESRGCIINTASISGLGVRGSSIAYSASKAGLISLTRSLAIALAPNVRVNAVAPGFVDTPWTKNWPDARRARAIERTLVGRMAAPLDIAEAMLFLGAGAAYMTGQTLVLDGGAA